MKVLVTGGSGQLGRALGRRGLERGDEMIVLDVEHLDVCNTVAVRACITAHRPDVVMNAAAYTAVDKAETERERAYAVNATGAGLVARECAEAGTRVVHISTDYVFDGLAMSPYREDDTTAPLGVYGESKLAGEREVHAAGGVVVRTSWLFEQTGPSFVHTILRLSQERPVLRVVDDQRGCPTWADDLADALLLLAHQVELESTYHFCNDGETTWHGFATSILDEARRHRPIMCERIDPIPTAEFPTPARRPSYSVLDTSRIRALGVTPPSWRRGLEHVVAQVLRS